MTTKLGTFDLHAPIASGGMGTVWLGSHQDKTQLAIKVLSNFEAAYLDAFKREVHAVAKLRHPRIVAIYDFGTVTEEEACASFPLGAGWFAMELATQGSLAARNLTAFEDVREVLIDILDALGHAHSRKLIHRDIKPENVLLVEENGRLRYKLSDFGIAHVRGESLSTHEVFASAGTPSFMAPEQIQSRWREYGPWTDLYSVGCLAYEMVTGRTPFVSDSVVGVARMHLFEPPPPLVPVFAIPEGFKIWIERLLMKHPAHRYRRAADARWALQRLRAPDLEPISMSSLDYSEELELGEFETRPKNWQPDTHDVVTVMTTLPIMPTNLPPVVHTAQSIAATSPPPIPENWRPVAGRAPLVQGVGLGLFGIKEPPFLGMEHEREYIWRALRDAAQLRRPKLVSVEGPSSSGKTRLVEWMSRRADELGAATVIWSYHGSTLSPGSGLVPAIERHLECVGLERDRVDTQIRASLVGRVAPDQLDDTVEAFVRLMRPDAADDIARAERFSTILRLLEIEAADRPIIVVIDDGHWGAESLDFANFVMNHRAVHGIAVLFLVTRRSDTPLGAFDHAEITPTPDTQVLSLAVMNAARHLAILDGALKLHPDARDILFSKTSHSLLFSLHVLKDWCDRDLLVASPNGYELKQEVIVPGSLFALWLERLSREFHHKESLDHGVQALEVAAALGRDVVAHEWEVVTETLGIKIPPELIDGLTALGLVLWTPSGWAFKHGNMREELTKSAKNHDRLKKYHRVIALYLASTHKSIANTTRTARHLLEAHEFELAVAPLLEAIRRCVSASRTQEAGLLIRQATIAVDRSNIPDNDARRATLLLMRMYLANEDHLQNTIPLLAKELLTNHPDKPALRSGALRMLAHYHMRQDEFSRSADLANQAVLVASESADLVTEAEALRTAGWACIFLSDYDQATKLLTKSLKIFESLRNPIEAASVFMALAETHRHDSKFERARDFAQQAHAANLDARNHAGMGTTLLVLGNIALSMGNLDEAERHLLESVKVLDSIGSSASEDSSFQLAIVYLHARKLREVEPVLQHLLGFYKSAEEFGRVAHVEFALAAVAAFRADPAAWDRHCDLANAYGSSINRDLSAVLHSVATEWTDRGDTHRASRADEIASRLGFGATRNTAVIEKWVDQ